MKASALRFLTNLKADLQEKNALNTEEQNLIMKLSPLYVKWEQEALQKGEQRGIKLGEQRGEQRGIKLGVQTERRSMIENMLEVRFGAMDAALAALVEPLSQLPSKEATQVVLQLSREELLTRFGKV